MLSRLQDFLSRHRRKFIVTGVLVGGAYCAARYAQRKLVEIHEKQAREMFERTRRTHHFESTEKTCNQVILGLGEEMCDAVLRECSTDELLEQLRQNPKNKVELWEEMKVVAFTRLATFVYASSMLVIALRVQLNLLGGYIYRDITTEQTRITDELKQQYLSLIRHFITEDGIRDLVRYIRTQVIAVVKSSMPLSRQLSLNDLEQLFWSLQMAINADTRRDPNSKMTKYLLPSQSSSFSPLLQQMYNETLDLLESEDAISVCTHNVTRGFVLACDVIAESLGETLHHLPTAEVQKQAETQQSQQFNQSSSSTSLPSSQAVDNNNLLNINTVLMAMAKLIPIISGITSGGYDSSARSTNLPTQLLSFYLVAEKSKTLGANVYETFSSA
ncbi:GL24760 [Drosophila persimilis]|uniref:Peroxisomal biogenesis factor 3 n=1 Tax=Drosophila persimilis TaxID=7234 RepID=B4GUE2_DROPE|nr:peroxisomal biogenesis factor 3 [Drosophila persimilis]EDW26225.1 GL24760 [Drosophila persimilis]